MKTTKLLILTFAVFFNALMAQENTNPGIPTLEGALLGQTPPGLTPKPFAPGIVSTDHWEVNGVFTPGMEEFYYVCSGGKYEKATFVVFKYKNNRWHESVVSPWVGRPVISPDGKTMHLGARYLERMDIGWSELKELKDPFREDPERFIMRLSAASNGTYYFDTYDEKNPEFPIRYSRLVDGKYEPPKALDKVINTGTQLNHPFIAPDESYLIWDAKREGGYGDSDIYISFKQPDGTWGKAINMGDKINTDAWEASGSVTPDGKYIFFNRNVGSDKYENVDIFWVDAQIIETLKPR